MVAPISQPKDPLVSFPDRAIIATDDALEAAMRAFIAALLAEAAAKTSGELSTNVAAPIFGLFIHSTLGADWVWTVGQDYVLHGGYPVGTTTMLFSRSASDDYTAVIGSTYPSQIRPGVILALQGSMAPVFGLSILLNKGDQITVSTNTVGHSVLFLSIR